MQELDNDDNRFLWESQLVIIWQSIQYDKILAGVRRFPHSLSFHRMVSHTIQIYHLEKRSHKKRFRL